MMHYVAHRVGLKTISALEDALSRADRRRKQLIRTLEDRRRTVQSMSRGLLHAKPAVSVGDATDVETSP